MILNFFLYLAFIFFSFGQIGRLSFFDQQINGYLYEFGILGVLGILGIKYKLEPLREALQKFRIVFIFFFALLTSYLSGLNNFSLFQNAVGFLYFLRVGLYFLFFFYLSYHLQRDKSSITVLRSGLGIFIGLNIIFSFTQYLFYPDLRNLIYASWDPHLFRLFGLFFDTSIAGGVYGLIFLFLLLDGKKVTKNDFLVNALLFIFLVFIVLTFSRILYLTVVVIALLILITKKLYRRSIVFLFGFLLLIFVAPKPGGEGVNLGRLFSVQSRLNDYKLALQIWQKNPVFGVGYNRIRYEKIKLNIEEEKDLVTSHSGGSFHSSLLVILVSGGIVGFMGFMGVLYSFAKMSRPIAYFVLFLSLLSLADNIFLHPFVLFLFLSIVLLDSFSLSRRQQ